MLFLGNDQSEIPIYMMLIGFGCFAWSIPCSRSWSIEVSERTENLREKYLVTNFMVFTREFFSGITFIVVGILMEQSNLM